MSKLIIVVAAASAVLSLSMGLRQSLGLFLDPMVQGAGISVAAFGLAMAIQNLFWGIGQPVMGALADRFGGRWVVAAASILFAIGLWLMSLGTLTGLYLGGGLLVGVAVAGTSHGVLVGIISRMSEGSRRARAISIVSAAGSLGMFVLAPTAQSLLDRIAWDGALMAFGIIALSIIALAVALQPNAGSEQVRTGDRPNAIQAIRAALTHPGYVAMTVAFFACGFQLIFIATHLPKYLDICGLPPSVGAGALALIGVGNACGALMAGYLGSRYGNKLVLASIYLLRTLAITLFVFLPIGPTGTLVFAGAMGVLWLSVIPPVSALLNGMFGATNFGALFGAMFLSHQIGAFLAAWLGGLTFDITGSYFPAWVSLIVVGALATIIQARMDEGRPDTPLPNPA